MFLIVYACNTKKELSFPVNLSLTIIPSAPDYHFVKNGGDFTNPGTDIKYTADTIPNAKAYVWHFADGSTNDSSLNPSTLHTYKKSGDYITTLTVYIQSGNKISFNFPVSIKVYDGIRVDNIIVVNGQIPINTTDSGVLGIYNASKGEKILDVFRALSVPNFGGVWVYNTSRNYPFPFPLGNDTIIFTGCYRTNAGTVYITLERDFSSKYIWQRLSQSDKDKLLYLDDEIITEKNNNLDIIRLYCKLNAI